MSEEQSPELAAAVMSFCVRVFVGHDGSELPSWCVRASDKGGTKRSSTISIGYIELPVILHYHRRTGRNTGG